MFSYTIRPVPEDEGGPGGEDIKVVADSRVVLQWEKAKKDRSISKLLAEPTLADAYVLAYLAAKRAGKIDCPPGEFEDKYLLLLGGEAAPDPTRSGR